MISRTRVGVLVALMLLPPSISSAQIARDSSVDWLLSAGSEGEQYLRTLQLLGGAAGTAWSIRPIGLDDAAPIVAGARVQPWGGQFHQRSPQRTWLRVVAPETQLIFNSRFPYGVNDGPVWAGRGLTLVASAGVHAGFGPIRLVLAPQFFRAQNAAYPIVLNGPPGPQQFGDAREPIGIDLPQRFGDRPYQRLDPGQSSVSIGLRYFGLGASTANEIWGPAVDNPFIVGANAAGFAHLFAAVDSRDLLGPLHLAVRVIAGRLDQSPYSRATPGNGRRYISGVLAVLQPRPIPGLELGVARVFEGIWPDTGLSVGEILSGTARSSLIFRPSPSFGGGDSLNQIASVFGRWLLPNSGFELYGELGREDNAFDVRDLLLEPDHDISYMLGLRRAWIRSDSSVLVLGGELLNSRPSQLNMVRPQAPPYVHDVVRQGHTQLGQLIGSPGAFGGAASSVRLDFLDRRGRRSFIWRRYLTEPDRFAPKPADVIHALTYEQLLFGRRVDLIPEATLAYNLNRDPGGDVVNLRLALTGRAHW